MLSPASEALCWVWDPTLEVPYAFPYVPAIPVWSHELTQQSAYQGIYGMRGCYSRIPYAKCSNSSEGQESVRSILGPLSASLDGIKLFYQSVLAAKPWEYDPWTPRMPWSDAAYNLADHGDGGKLCFAIMWTDGVVDAVPPYKRAMEELKAALEAQGHEGGYRRCWMLAVLICLQ